MDYARMLFRSLWSIILIVLLIIAFDIPVYIATPLVTVLNMFVDRLKWWEIRPMFFRAVLQDGVLTVPTRDSGEVRG